MSCMAKADKLLEQAKDHFSAGESVLAFVSGAYETKVGKHDTLRNGVLIATNQRILFYAKRLTGFDLEAFPYKGISSLEMGRNLGGRWIKFFASGNTVSMKWIQDDMTAFVNVVQLQMADRGDGADMAAGAALASQPDEGGELTEQDPKAEKAQVASGGEPPSGCMKLVGVLLAIFAIFGLVVGIISLVDYVTEDPEVREQRETEARERREAKEAKERVLELALRCVEAADKPTNLTGPWSCRYCFHPGIDAAIKARLRSSSSYDGGALAWGKTPLGFYFVQGFTAQNVYGATLDYHAKGTFGDKNCEVLSIEIFEGRGF